MSFSEWILSLNNIHLRFLNVFSWLNSSFLLNTAQYYIFWMCHVLCIHSPTEGHLGCFQVWAIMNEAVIKIQVQDFCVDINFQLLWVELNPDLTLSQEHSAIDSIVSVGKVEIPSASAITIPSFDSGVVFKIKNIIVHSKSHIAEEISLKFCLFSMFTAFF